MNDMRLLFLILPSLIFQASIAQFSYDWKKNIDERLLISNNFGIDQFGNSYLMLGYTPEEGNQLQSPAGEKRIADEFTLAKLDTTGKIIWHLTENALKGTPKNYKTRSNAYFRDIAVSEDGESIAIMGYYQSKKVLGDNDELGRVVRSFSNYEGLINNYFILCYSNTGDLKWRRNFTSTPAYNQQLDNIQFGPENRLFMTKAYKDLDFGKERIQSATPEEERIGVFRFSEKGKFEQELISWKQSSLLNKDFSSHHYIQSLAINFDPKGNIYLTGDYRAAMVLSEDVTFKSQERYKDFHAGFLVKYSPEMELKWQFKLGGSTGGGIVRNLIFHEDGGVSFAGDFSTNIIISTGSDVIIKTESPAINYSGRGVFYGKIDQEGNLKFVKYHTQEKHYTNCDVATMWVDDYDQIHIIGFYNDSLKFDGVENTLFGGSITKTNTTSYEGKELSYETTTYDFDLYHACFREDTLLTVNYMFDFNQIIGYRSNFFIDPKVIGESLYFTLSSHMDVDAELVTDNNSSIKHTREDQSAMVKLSLECVELSTPEQRIVAVQDSVVNEIDIHPLPINIDTLSLAEETDTITTNEVIDAPAGLPLVKAYPNPFQSSVSVEFSNAPLQFQAMLYNSNGQLIVSQMHRSDGGMYKLELDLSRLANATYYLLIYGENYKKTIPLVKSGP